MGKKQKFEQVFYKTYGEKQPTWKELKDFELQDDDIVTISYEEPYFSDDNSYDGQWFIDVIRPREETDEEYQKRIESEKANQERLKQNRYQQYLKLKEEFEKQ